MRDGNEQREDAKRRSRFKRWTAKAVTIADETEDSRFMPAADLGMAEASHNRRYRSQVLSAILLVVAMVATLTTASVPSVAAQSAGQVPATSGSLDAREFNITQCGFRNNNPNGACELPAGQFYPSAANINSIVSGGVCGPPFGAVNTSASSSAGDPTPVDYQVADFDGQVAQANVVVTYLPLGEIPGDESLGNNSGADVIVDILANDGDVDPTSVQLIDPSTGLPIAGDLVVPGEGTWSVDPVTGALTFSPEDGFLGDPTPVDYSVNNAQGVRVEANVVVTYGEPGEIPGDESLGNVAGTAVTVDILANDGDVDPTSVQLVDPVTGLPVTGDLVVPGEGTWTVDPVSGALTFTPEDSFDGDPTPVDYVVTSVLGEVVTATATITYADPVTTPSAPVLALTGVESYQLALLALLALGAGFGMLRFSNTLLIVRKDDE